MEHDGEAPACYVIIQQVSEFYIWALPMFASHLPILELT
jgi:hypothetical protein